jgi:hypothetical protein
MPALAFVYKKGGGAVTLLPLDLYGLSLLVLDHEIFKGHFKAVVRVGRSAVKTHLENGVFYDIPLTNLHPIKTIF